MKFIYSLIKIPTRNQYWILIRCFYEKTRFLDDVLVSSLGIMMQHSYIIYKIPIFIYLMCCNSLSYFFSRCVINLVISHNWGIILCPWIIYYKPFMIMLLYILFFVYTISCICYIISCINSLINIFVISF